VAVTTLPPSDSCRADHAIASRLPVYRRAFFQGMTASLPDRGFVAQSGLAMANSSRMKSTHWWKWTASTEVLNIRDLSDRSIALLMARLSHLCRC
jgi:hypothetical protein